MAAHEALAPLHWDAEEFDFGIASEEDEPETEGEEDLQFLFQEELESGEDFSWEGADSSEEIGSSSSDDMAAGGNPHQFLKAPSEGSEEGSSSGGGDNGDGSSDDDDDDDDDGGDAPPRSPKHRRFSDTYDW